MNSVIECYDELAARYDRRWASYTKATIHALASFIDLRGDERLLDAPCGTGAFEEWLHSAHPAIGAVGVDASGAMLERAKIKHAGRGYEWVKAKVHELPFPDASFDRIVCANSFHCFDRPEEVLVEFARVLRPSGRLTVLDWCDDFLVCKLCSIWLHWFDRAFLRTFSASQCRDLLTNAGFRIRRSQLFRHRIIWGLMVFECEKPNSIL